MADFNQTRDQIITDALFLIGRIGEGETPTSDSITKCSNLLNKMLKHWETQGVHLWAASYGTIFLNENQRVYTLNNDTDHACDDDTLTETTLSSNASGTSISVTSIGLTSVGYVVGVLLDDGTRHWTTVTAIAGTGITLADALPSAATSGNSVFTYEEELGKPLKLTDSTLRYSEFNDLNMRISGRVEYNRIVSKEITGLPNLVYYSPEINTGKIYVWPVPMNSDCRLKVSYIQRIEAFADSSSNPDLPPEWLHGLTYNLARVIAPAYGVDLQRKDLTDIIAIAQQSMEELKAWDSDTGSTSIRPLLDW